MWNVHYTGHKENVMTNSKNIQLYKHPHFLYNGVWGTEMSAGECGILINKPLGYCLFCMSGRCPLYLFALPHTEQYILL